MQGQKVTLSYDKRAVLENFFNKFIDWIKSDGKDKKEIVSEAVNTFETMIEFNSLTVKELNQRVVDETLHELATKDFVKAEIANVRTEIADLKFKVLYWMIGTALVSITTIIGAVYTMLTFMLGKFS